MLRYVTGIFLALAGGTHLIRSFAGWDLTVNGYSLPIWVSAVIGVLLAGLSWAHLCPT